MEEQERPTKLRKLQHDEMSSSTLRDVVDDEASVTAGNVPVNGTAESRPRASPNSKKPQTDPADAADRGDAHNATPSLEPAATSTTEAAPASADPDPDPDADADPDATPAGLSKNQLKKLRKAQEWEAGRAYRKLKRKEKTQAKRQRKRAARDAEAARAAASASVNGGIPVAAPPKTPLRRRPVQLPVTIVIDCGFDDLMSDKERISLGSQITRSYSDNSHAPFQSNLVISSWGGKLKERFDTVVRGHYKNWRGVTLEPADWVVASAQAKSAMAARGKMRGVFGAYDDTDSAGRSQPEVLPAPLPAPEVVYLTSDSPHTLTALAPHSVYIVGGLVDKNRHKGICYRVAQDVDAAALEKRGIDPAALPGGVVKTAKLPIGEYMEMQSRKVLATNHVVEIMLRWLECGDWGGAFLQVIPKRKGGQLRKDVGRAGEEAAGGGAEDQAEDDDDDDDDDDDGDDGDDEKDNTHGDADELDENGDVDEDEEDDADGDEHVDEQIGKKVADAKPVLEPDGKESN